MAALEWALRPFSQTNDVLQRVTDRQPVPPEEPEAGLCWGKASTFGRTPGGLQPLVTSVTITWPEEDDDEEEEEEEDVVLEYNETARSVSQLRVENPDDPEQYVIVERIESITFQGPDGRKHRFNLTN